MKTTTAVLVALLFAVNAEARTINASDPKYAGPSPSRLHNAWADVSEFDTLLTPYAPQNVPGLYRIAAPLRVNKRNVTIIGGGRYNEGAGWIAASRDSDVIVIEATGTIIQDLCITRWFWQEGDTVATPGLGSGISFYGKEPISCVIERVSILYMGHSGLRFAGTAEAGYMVAPILRDVTVYGCGRDGIYGWRTTAAEANVYVTRCGGAAIRLEDSAGGRWHATIHSCRGPYQVELRLCASIEMHAWIEDYDGREGVLLKDATACEVGGFFSTWASTSNVRLSGKSVGNTVRSSSHYGSAVVTDGNEASVRNNVIMPQPGATVRVNSRRNRIL